MKRPMVIVIGSVLAASLVAAQGEKPDQKLLTKYRGWLDLMGTVYSLGEMDKQPGLNLNAEQSKKALPILKNLNTREDLRPNDATAIIEKLEKDVANAPKQQQYLETASQKRDAEIRKARESGKQPNLPFVRFSFALFGMVQAMEGDKQPYNPFRGGPGEDDLRKLMGLLEKR